MSKIAVVYWSGTGNTESMAKAVLNGAKSAGAEGVLFSASEFDPSAADDFDGIAFGCPSMGSEELEESEFAPMFEACEGKLEGKKTALFGSYGWGDGEWMRSWRDKCLSDGARLTGECVICNGEPDDGILKKCEALGASLV